MITTSKTNKCLFLSALIVLSGCSSLPAIKIPINSKTSSFNWSQETNIVSVLQKSEDSLNLSLSMIEQGVYTENGYELTYLEKSRINPVTDILVVETSELELTIPDFFSPHLDFDYSGRKLKVGKDWKFDYETTVLYNLEMEGVHSVIEVNSNYVKIHSTGIITSGNKDKISGYFNIITKISLVTGLQLDQVSHLSFTKKGIKDSDISTNIKAEILYNTEPF